MKKLLLLAVVALPIGVITVSGLAQSAGHAPAGEATIRGRCVGAWRLVRLEEPRPDGKIHRTDCTGLLVFTGDGHMSVQVMYRKPQTGAQAGPVQYAQGGYEASYGTYRIEDAHTFTYHVDGALVRSLIGKDFRRIYVLSGKQLTVKPADPNEYWKAAWQHY